MIYVDSDSARGTRREFTKGLAGTVIGGSLASDTSVVSAQEESSLGEENWRFSTNSSIHSSPTVIDGTVYFGSNDGHVYAVDTSTGNEKWRYDTGSEVRSSPTVVDETLYIGSLNGNLYAINSNSGKERWVFATGSFLFNEAEIYSSPTVMRGTVYFGSTDGNLYAVDAATGDEKWKYETGAEVRSSPVVVDDRVYFGSEDNTCYCVDVVDGRKIWENDSYSSPSSLTFSDDTVYFGYDYSFIAVDAESGDEKWQSGVGNSTETPTVADGTVYVNDDSLISAIDSETGNKKWNYRLSESIVSGPKSSPTVASDVVYVGGRNGNLYAIDTESGEELWRFETSVGIGSSPTVAGGAVYFGSSDGNLYSVNSTASMSTGSRVSLGTLGHHDNSIQYGQDIDAVNRNKDGFRVVNQIPKIAAGLGAMSIVGYVIYRVIKYKRGRTIETGHDTNQTQNKSERGKESDQCVEVHNKLSKIEDNLSSAKDAVSAYDYERGLDLVESTIRQSEQLLEDVDDARLTSAEQKNIQEVLYEARELQEWIENEKQEYETTQSRIEYLETLLGDVENHVEKGRISEAIKEVDELYDEISDIPEGVSKYGMEEKVRDIKNRCDDLVMEIKN